MTRKDATLVGIGEELLGWFQRHHRKSEPSPVLRFHYYRRFTGRYRPFRRPQASRASVDAYAYAYAAPSLLSLMWQTLRLGIAAGVVVVAIFAFFVLLLVMA